MLQVKLYQLYGIIGLNIIFFFIQNLELLSITDYSLTSNTTIFLRNPWVILTYSWLHGSFIHLFLNMLIMYIFGMVFLQHFHSLYLLGIYLIGGILGGVFFLIFNIQHNPLIGSSSAIYSIITAVLIQNYRQKITVFELFSWPAWLFAILFLLLNIIPYYTAEWGALSSHVGGMLAGVLFGLFLKKKKYAIRPYARNDYDYNAQKKARQAELDKILDKIAQSGYNSLNKAERDFLAEESKS